MWVIGSILSESKLTEGSRTMSDIETAVLTGRDRAVLRAVAAGRCQLGVGYAPVLWIDGFLCADSTVGHRLVAAGLIFPSDPGRPLDVATLTEAGRAALAG
jgi:hypothetical protein